MPSNSYARLKKWRYFQKKKKTNLVDDDNRSENNDEEAVNREENDGCRSEVGIQSEQCELNRFEHPLISSNSEPTDDEMEIDNDYEAVSDYDEIIADKLVLIEKKVRNWALRNRTNTTLQ